MSKIKAARDPTDASIQLCRIGLTNNAITQELINTVGSYFVTSSLSTTIARKKRSTSILTCSDLNSISGSLNSLTVIQIATLTSVEFKSCQVLLGASTNSWSSDQLSSLAAIAKIVRRVFYSLNKLSCHLISFPYRLILSFQA